MALRNLLVEIGQPKLKAPKIFNLHDKRTCDHLIKKN